MKCYAQTLELVDDPARIAEYREYHKKAWPEVVRGLRGIGITRMKIFLHGNRLFMYFEAPVGFDPVRDYQTYAQDERVIEWDRLMRTYQQQVPGADPEVWWTPMDEVFDLESCL